MGWANLLDEFKPFPASQAAQPATARSASTLGWASLLDKYNRPPLRARRRSQPPATRQQRWARPIFLSGTTLPCEAGTVASHRPLVNKIGLGQSSRPVQALPAGQAAQPATAHSSTKLGWRATQRGQRPPIRQQRWGPIFLTSARLPLMRTAQCNQPPPTRPSPRRGHDANRWPLDYICLAGSPRRGHDANR